MAVLTLYFGGTSQGLNDKGKNLLLAQAYRNTTGPKAFLPGPGSTDTTIYQYGMIPNKLKIGKNANKSMGNAAARQLDGTGWNRNVWYGLQMISEYLVNNKGPVTINMAGHSRGSITIIMLLNDIFRTSLGAAQGFTIQNAKLGKTTFDLEDFDDDEDDGDGNNEEFKRWYRKSLEQIFVKRMGTQKEAKLGVRFLSYISHHRARLKCNVLLFDPVGGKNLGETSRKLDLPDHPQINCVRVIRMEQGGMMGGLSTAMPTFKDKGYTFYSGDKSADLLDHKKGERSVVPLPGTHGNPQDVKYGAPAYIGASYLSAFLTDHDTAINDSFTSRFGHSATLLAAYNALYKKYKDVEPGAVDGNVKAKRKAIHTHHTVKNGVGSYAGDSVNAHHSWLGYAVKHKEDVVRGAKALEKFKF